jgi:hypothetical protein
MKKRSIGEQWRAWLRERPALPDQERVVKSNLRAIFNELLRQATDGELKAATILLEYAYGKPESVGKETTDVLLTGLLDEVEKE